MREELRQRIDLLLERQPDIFGANGHHFALNKMLGEEDVEGFERRHGISLPEDYRWFLTTVGNGGAGPYYGVFPLGEMDDGHEIAPWETSSAIVGSLSEPFPHTTAWNDLSGEPGEDPAETDAEYEARLESFENVYWSPKRVSGAMPICHMGCALRIWLVVTGTERGHLWLDKRADREGLEPLLGVHGPRTSFLEWYQAWVDASLLEPATAETFEEAFSRALPEPSVVKKPLWEHFRDWWRA